MARFTRILLLLLLVVVIAGAVFLVMWDIPPPEDRIELQLDTSRLPE